MLMAQRLFERVLGLSGLLPYGPHPPLSDYARTSTSNILTALVSVAFRNDKETRWHKQKPSVSHDLFQKAADALTSRLGACRTASFHLSSTPRSTP
jgi:hypothetical protein